MRKWKSLIYLWVLVIGCLSCGGPSGVKDGETVPEFQATLIDGTPFKLSDYKGDYVLIDFWASWCGPCRRENPRMAAFYRNIKDKKTAEGHGFTLVTIALERSQDNWKQAAQKDGFFWPLQIVDESSIVMTSEMAQFWGVTEIPAKFLIEPDGKLNVGWTLAKVDHFISPKFH